MNSAPLLRALRKATPPPAWRVAERLVASGQVTLRSRDDELGELVLAVSPGSNSYDVSLWPEEGEWECECEAPTEGCAHAAAAALTLEKGLEAVEEAESPPHIVFRLTRDESRLRLGLAVRVGGEVQDWGPDDHVPGLRKADVTERLLRLMRSWPGDRVPGRHHTYLLAALLHAEEVLLDGERITASRVPFAVVVKVDRFGDDWRVRLGDGPEVSDAWDGEPPLVLADGVLRPRGYGKLSSLQRHQLRNPVLFSEFELPRLTAEWLPALEKAVRVLREEGVPETRFGDIELRLEIRANWDRVDIVPRIVYGDPPVAELQGDVLLPVGGVRVLPPRHRRREWELTRQLERELSMRPGRALRLPGPAAALWLRDRLPAFTGRVIGQQVIEANRVQQAVLDPVLRWGRDGLDVSFGDGQALVSARRAIEAWRGGQSLIKLSGDNGWAPLPGDWLEAYGERVALLLDREEDKAAPHMAPLAAELIASVGGTPPPDLRPLVQALRGAHGLPDSPLHPDFAGELRDYQDVGRRWLGLLGEHGLGGVLADDMGLGKTIQALAVLLGRREEGPALVVAPTSVLVNWLDEAERFSPTLRCTLLHGPRRERAYRKLRSGEVDVCVTSYALLRRDIAILEKIDWGTVILDEAQAIKNPDSQTARAARTLRAGARAALTGTPIENHLAELWSLMEFLNPGFFGTRKSFEERLGDPASQGDPRALRALRDRVRPFVLRRLKEEVAAELPPRTEVVLHCPMSKDQKRAYDAVRLAALEGLARTDGDGRKKGQRRMQVLAALTRLRQASCHAGLVPGGRLDDESGKLDVLLETLEEIIDEGHRALVFSQWTSLLNLVEPRLDAAGLGFVRLDGSTRDRAGVVAAFQAPDGPPVMLISLMAGGTGLNLTAADHVFHLDPWWNPAVERQATDRAHRIGQDKPVIAWKLVSEGTVEERVLELQKRKKELADAVLEGADGGKALSGDDLEALLV